MKNKIIIIITFLLMIGCGNDNSTKTNPIVEKEIVTPLPKIEAPDFNGDSAYLYVKEQVDFGPRFPNNEAHGKCAKFLENKLKSFGLTTITQIGEATTFNNKKIIIKNIIGEYNPGAEKRILLFAHWDSRPFADQDIKDMTKPILGANDGASGVGILLEIARQLTIKKPQIGVDIIFFDAEDYGQPAGMQQTVSESYCLGSQYWAKNMHKEDYKA
ncbi:MAG: M28 family peptidase, partial [Flavobacteriales bacterium]|nr:M28 family peptidase [Flavobacteriales bacterium]